MSGMRFPEDAVLLDAHREDAVGDTVLFAHIRIRRSEVPEVIRTARFHAKRTTSGRPAIVKGSYYGINVNEPTKFISFDEPEYQGDGSRSVVFGLDRPRVAEVTVLASFDETQP